MGYYFDYKEEFERRIRLIVGLREDEELRKDVMAFYATHPVEWINDFAITYDPRARIKTLPFVLFPRQRDLVQFLFECVRDGESGLIEKCRDAGATWVACCFAVWMWVFVDGSSSGFGSRKEDLVDRIGDPDSIFEKMRMLIVNLPSFMRPDYDAPRMKIMNFENGSTITGEGGPNIGRGGRKSIYFKDESAHYEQAESIEAALLATTDVQIDISSVNGSANVFYNKRMAGEVWMRDKAMTRGKTRIFIFDWREDPRKNQEWYDIRRKTFEDNGLSHIFAQEVDRDYTGSTERIIIPQKWVRAAIDAHIKLGFTDGGEAVAGQDVADGGGDKNALAIRKGVVLRHASAWGGEAGDAPFIAMPTCLEYGVTLMNYDSAGVGSGFKAGVNQMVKAGTVPGSMIITPWNGGASVQDPLKPIIERDKTSPKNEDQYLNLKAQSWFRLRARFQKTFAAVTAHDRGEAVMHQFSEMISLSSEIPQLQELCMELSQPIYKENGAGKTLVDKAPGANKSPNLGDAVMICYNPIRKAVGFFNLPPAPGPTAG